MRTSLKIATILTWINLIIWGLISFLGILASFMASNAAPLIISFLMGAIVLHSYAALQLHKSIRNPAVPLSNQTPVGIRFIGFVALFFGVLYIGDGIAVLQNAKEFMKMLQPYMGPQPKNFNPTAFVRGMGGFFLLAGASIVINVILNIRLLRWYFLMKGVV